MINEFSGMHMCCFLHGIDAGLMVFMSTISVKGVMTDQFAFNSDGTISPTVAKHLVLGFQVPGKEFT